MTEANCKVARGPDRTWPALKREGMFRTPRAAVMFGDVALTGTRVRETSRSRARAGTLYDHIALSVTDLDAWVAKLRDEGVTFLEQPYKLGDTRAVMIEGPSREALELVEDPISRHVLDGDGARPEELRRVPLSGSELNTSALTRPIDGAEHHRMDHWVSRKPTRDQRKPILFNQVLKGRRKTHQYATRREFARTNNLPIFAGKDIADFIAYPNAHDVSLQRCFFQNVGVGQTVERKCI